MYSMFCFINTLLNDSLANKAHFISNPTVIQDKTSVTSYTATEDCFVFCRFNSTTDGESAKISIDGITVFRWYKTTQSSLCIPLKKDSVLSVADSSVFEITVIK